MEDKTSKSENLKLDKTVLHKLFNIAWLSMYRANGIRKDSLSEENYRNLQATVIKRAMEEKYDEANLLAQLKLVDILYKEIIENDFPTIAKRQGMSQKQAKELLYEKIFRGEQQKGEEIQKEEATGEVLENEKALSPDNSEVDFEHLYDSTLIANMENGEKDIQYKANPSPRTIEYRDEHKKVAVTLLGKMQFHNVFGLIKDVYKYSVMIYTSKAGEPRVDTCTVFGRIDFSLVESDQAYRKATFEEVFNQTNINRKDNASYVGEIGVKGGINQKGYSVIYDSEDYTAVRVFTEQNERKLKEILDEIRGESK